MNLLLFDIDGTLTDTSREDTLLFAAALAEVAGVPEIPENWDDFPEVTAPAVARALIGRKKGRRARDGEVFQVREAMSKGWENAIKSGSVTVRPIPGAGEALASARERPGFFTSIVSGAWGPPAVHKLIASGLPVNGLVLSSADDSETRKGIVNTAEILSAAERAIPGFSRVVLVGDGVWDARAAKAVNAGFVGVAANEDKTTRLRAEGAAAVIPDYTDLDRFWAAVDAAVKGTTLPVG